MSGQAKSGLLFDLATLGISSAGIVTGGESLKQIFLTITNGIAGSRIAISKNYFADRSPTSVRLQMEKDRSTFRVILEDSAKMPDADYDLQKGFADLTEYYNRGTIRHAFDQLDIEQSAAVLRAEDAELSKRLPTGTPQH